MKILNRFKKILIVEDDRPLRSALVDKLSREGYRVSYAKDGREGLRMANEEKPHMILLDQMLPGLDGLSFLKELRNPNDPWGLNVPVLVITALGETDERRVRTAEYNVVDYFDKAQHSIEDIVAKVKEVL